METYNYLKNGNMEKSANWTRQAYGGSNTFTVSRTGAESYFGKYSYKIQSTTYSSGSKARVYQDITSADIIPGHTYTLSVYLKISNIQSSENKYGAAISAASLDSSNNVINTKYSEMINETTDVNLENGWRKVSVTFTVPSNSVKTRVDLFLFQATGTVYFDGIQLEEGSTHNPFNLIENAGFEVHTTGTVPAGWSAVNIDSTTDTCTTSNKQDGAFSFKFSADQSVEKLLEQEIDINSNDNGTYIFSGWVKNSRIKSSIINNEFIDSSTMMIAEVEYTDSSVEKKEFLMFNSSLSDWQYCSGTFNTASYEDVSKVPCKIKIILRSANQANDCYFDDIQLIKSSTKSYDYNNGDLISVSESPESQETMEYNDHDLTGITDSKGYDSEYTYDNKHNLTSPVNQRGITYNYSYDLYGNVTSLSIHDNSDTDNYEIKTDTSYTNDKLFVSQVTDEDGNTVNYNYNANTGTLTSETDSKGTTSYTYNSNNDLPQTVSKGNVTVNYGYTSGTNRNLTSISNGNVSYGIDYDEYNNVQSTRVGSNVLASYNYGNSNNSLQTLTYGNGDYINYFYDEYGNVREIKQNGVSAFKWETDNSGNLTKFVDLRSSREYNYIYNTAGKLTSENIKGTAGNLVLPFARVNYGYDLNDNVSKLINTVGKRTVKVDYSYQQDNLPSTVKIDNDKTKYFTYDSLGRLSSTKMDLDHDIITVYTYKASDRNTGSSKVYQTSKIETESIGGNLKYKYTYDASGNITGIYRYQNGPYVIQNLYEYDSFNQLTKDTDYLHLTRTDYTYDNYGNIKKVIKYSINTSGNVVSTIDTINYLYTDSTWSDKLTSYDGTAITYDAIGNPLSYRDGISMTWKNGRELATLSNGNYTVSYKYNSDGLRTVKYVNGSEYSYEYVNGKLLYETKGTKHIHYVYDSNGNVISAIYNPTSSGTEQIYYYAHNWRGDVIALYNSAGTLFARYEYDAWGKLLSVKDSSGNAITDSSNFAIINSIRYRGYYYDNESGLYYLQSRYYDPTTGRFINADKFEYLGASDKVKNYNLFAYCDNNSIIKLDVNGNIAITTCIIIGAAIGVASQYALDVIFNVKDQKKGIDIIKPSSSWIDYLGACVSGGLSGSGIGIGASVVFNAGIGGLTYLANCGISGSTINNSELLISVGTGAFAGWVGGEGMGKSANLATLNKNLSKKLFSGSIKTATKGIKYYFTQTKTLYQRFLLKPIINSSVAGKLFGWLFSRK